MFVRHQGRNQLIFSEGEYSNSSYN